ncbi:MAG: hypothetical protein VX475_19260, partial [Myxococcota bacterium]|nr:hypothetical protein [Myxococcota bacterium]
MYIKRRMERTVILKRSVLRMQMGVTGAAFDSWSEHHRRRAVAKRAMGRLANTRLCAVWGSFVEGVEVSMAERKDEDHMDALRAIRREMEEQAVSATAIRSRLCAKLGGRFMKHWSEQLVADCWHAWCAQTNQRITWNIAVRHALARLQHSRVSIVFAEWSAWVEMQQAWAVMLSQGIESMSRVRLQFFFGRWSSYAARMATLDGIQRRAVQRLSHRQQSFAFEAWSMTACFRRRSRTIIERLRQSSDARLLLWSFASWQERTSD